MITDRDTENATKQPPGDTAGRERERPHGKRRDEVEGKGAPDATATSSSLKPLQVISSVLAAGLGVQSSRNRERDFKQGRAVSFIVAGLVFTALFVAGIYTAVSLVLAGR